MKRFAFLRTKIILLFRVPIVGWMLRHWRIRRRYAIERRVLAGRQVSHSDRKSVVFFTVHRAGSSFIGSLLKKIVSETDLVPVDLDGYFFHLNKGKAWETGNRTNGKIHYQKRGYLYGPFRSYHRGIKNLDDFKVVLVLRDPRDVIVSGFYSLYSHAFPAGEKRKFRKARIERRKDWLNLGIDRYVSRKLESRPNYLDRYHDYCKYLLGKPNVLFLKYEDMVLHFESWLARLLDFLELKISPELKEEIMRISDFTVEEENIYSHKRQVSPGDHHRKLKKETIALLETKARDILQRLDY
jgi:hypothetical protein